MYVTSPQGKYIVTYPLGQLFTILFSMNLVPLKELLMLETVCLQIGMPGEMFKLHSEKKSNQAL